MPVESKTAYRIIVGNSPVNWVDPWGLFNDFANYGPDVAWTGINPGTYGPTGVAPVYYPHNPNEIFPGYELGTSCADAIFGSELAEVIDSPDIPQNVYLASLKALFLGLKRLWENQK